MELKSIELLKVLQRAHEKEPANGDKAEEDRIRCELIALVKESE